MTHHRARDHHHGSIPSGQRSETLGIARQILVALSVCGLGLGSISTQAEDYPPPRDSVAFFNGDYLQGSLLGISGDGRIRWQQTYFTAPAEFSSAEVDAIRLVPPSTFTNSTTNPNTKVHLTNGDHLVGSLVSLDDQKLVLDTPCAGRLTIARPMLASLIPNLNTSPSLYRGPNSQDEWTNHNQFSRWKVRQGVLVTDIQGNVSRQLPPVDSLRLDFDYRYQGLLALDIVLHANLSPAKGFINGYWLRLASNTILLIYTSAAQSNSTPSAGFLDPHPDTLTHVTLISDKVNRTVHLYINSRKITEWTLPADLNLSGNTLAFCQRTSNRIEISNIQVSQWDGLFPLVTENTTTTQADVIYLPERSPTTGIIQSIANNQVSIQSDQKTSTIALDTIQAIHFNAAHHQTPRRHANDVRAMLANNGQITGEILSLDDTAAQVRSETFGTATFRRDALVQLLFNLYAKRRPDTQPPKLNPANNNYNNQYQLRLGTIQKPQQQVAPPQP